MRVKDLIRCLQAVKRQDAEVVFINSYGGFIIDHVHERETIENVFYGNRGGNKDVIEDYHAYEVMLKCEE